ncbi:hypothetical protein C7Y66_24015 [Chroococcidiopsis sp. CCALA 051]|uniref:hypothetical protein n=1 Tax=Chroococcidiopsis sp. CCALA 051 TaxID=869949 RepID=UPI000D0D1C8C|nr:hypothetical protein [Chroococcidiopsis sp. CCALA 051]MBE9016547.1 hypothetical protein [Chroococcidiopsidales cyanobacterium LEGE 13417]PSM46651.1 hypothetical protein C7Y66_24015 [Chroococcidiopsis sp. CCALA 051]
MGDFNLVKNEFNIISLSWEFTIKAVRKIPLIPEWIFAGCTLATVLANVKTFPFHSYIQTFKNYLEENWLDFFLELDRIFTLGAEILRLLLILISVDRLLKLNLSYFLDRIFCLFLVLYCYVSLRYSLFQFDEIQDL